MTQEPDFRNLSLLDLFNIEVKAQSNILNDCLLTLETNPHSLESLEALMRAAHSIKGAARIVQIDAVVNLAHRMEDCFVAAQAGKITLNTSQIDILLHAVDMLISIAEECSGDVIPKIDLNRIQSLIDSIPVVEVLKVITDHIPPTNDHHPQTNHPINPQKPTPIEPTPIEPTPIEPTSESSQPTTEILPVIHVATPPVNPVPIGTSHEFASVEPVNTMQNRVVRVSADNLNRLMGLAGESLVEAKWLETFTDLLVKLKTNQVRISNLLDKLQELWSNNDLFKEDHLEYQYFNQQIEEQVNLARQTSSEFQQLLGDRHNELEQFCQRFSSLSDRLYRQVIATHMNPFSDRGQGFPRLVRDLAKQLGKQVKLEIIGKSTLVDRDILERLETPLIHILRNAIDHGIETPQERLAVGKPPEGTIRIEIVHRAGMLLITVSDDGRGINIEDLRQQIVRKELTSPDMAKQLSEAELMDFLFLPGFSTAKSVTEISGRGVGLDIVHSTVREVGGTLRAVSQPGKNMIIYLQLPLTLSVLRTLLVEIANEPYAFALARIDRVVMLPRSEIIFSENQPFFMLNDQPVGLISAHQILEISPRNLNQEFLPIVVISDVVERNSRNTPIHHYGIVVDRFLGECNLVVRPLDPRLGKVPNISAAALMDDGSPVLIVDVEDLVRSISKVINSGQNSQINQNSSQTIAKTYKRILVVDDSITVREMERKLLENNGYKVDVAVNGMDGWNAVRSGNYELVVTDIDMPRMNGFELTTQIRSFTKLKQLPVIIVSYKDREEDRIQGLEAGANYYLTKSSFHDSTLLKAVIDLIGEA